MLAVFKLSNRGARDADQTGTCSSSPSHGIYGYIFIKKMIHPTSRLTELTSCTSFEYEHEHYEERWL